MNRLARFLRSLAGRIALLLSLGTMLAVAVSLFAAERSRAADFRRIQADRVLASAVDVVARLRRDPRTMRALATDQIIGATLVRRAIGEPIADETLTAALGLRGAPAASLAHIDPSTCMADSPFWNRSRTAGFSHLQPPDCWLLVINEPARRLRIAIDLPPVPRPPSTLSAPLFLVLMALSCIALSLLVARFATAPLRRVAEASRAFAHSIDAEAVAEAGPIDVRETLATFNLMQERVRSGVKERTRLLAAISHDLQTPLTRLRLRLEKVDDALLRDRLIADLSATLVMVRRGLDLARGGDSVEPWSVVDLDSLLSSMADDAEEAGQPVSFATGCGARVRVKPDALSRCLGNLIDNAVKHGGGAEISCLRVRNGVRIVVRDHGPGIQSDLLHRVFEPFVRGDVGRSAGEGTGIGLAIARAQANAIGATLTLSNRDDGLDATLFVPTRAAPGGTG